MKTISVKNWKGCVSAELSLSPGIHLVFGYNEAGKSSLLEAIGYTATGAKLSTDQKRAWARGGKTEVSISDEQEESIVTRTLPTDKRVTNNWDHRCSDICAGLVKLTKLKPADRQPILAQHLKSKPTLKQLHGFLKPHGFSEAESKTIFDEIEEAGPDGWNIRLEAAKELGQRLKGQWQEAAAPCERINFGIDQSKDWIPPGWEKDLAKASRDSLERQVTDAKDDLEIKLQSKAVEAEEIARLHELWLGRDATANELKVIEEELKIAEFLLQAARDEYASLPQPKPKKAEVKETVYQCAHCAQDNVLRGGKLYKPEDKKAPEEEPEDTAAILAALEESRKKGSERSLIASNLRTKLAELKAKAKTEANAHASWIELVKREGGSTEQEIEEAREKVRVAEQRLKIFTSWQRCTQLYTDISKQLQIIEALKPAGVRQIALKEAIDHFNKKILKPLCEIAGWGIVELHQDMDITMDGATLLQLSESQLCRVDVTFQFAFAKLDGSFLILIDRLDVYDAERRGQLVSLLEETEVPVICTRMVDDRSDAFDIAEDGLGRSYWIERGYLEVLGDA